MVKYPGLYLPDIYPRPKVCSTSNLSTGGVRIETHYSLEAGETIEIIIPIASRVIRCQGQVIHSQRPEGQRLLAGVRFKDLSQKDRAYLEEYLSEIMEQKEEQDPGGIEKRNNSTDPR
jgi:hypothetical protein